MEFGVYDNYDNITVAELEQHYGVHSSPLSQLPGQTGASYPADEDNMFDFDAFSELDDNWVDMDDMEFAEAVAEASCNSYTNPVSVPENNSSFVSDAEMHAFALTLSSYETSGYILSGYGMLPAEWNNGVYTTVQAIPVGRSKCPQN